MAKKLKDETPKVAEKNENPFANISSVIRDLNSHYGKKIIRTGEDIPVIHKVPFDEPALDYLG